MFIVRFLLLSLSISICAQEQKAKRNPQAYNVLAEFTQVAATQKPLQIPFNYEIFTTNAESNLIKCNRCTHYFRNNTQVNSKVFKHFQNKHKQILEKDNLILEKLNCPHCSETCNSNEKRRGHINKHHPNSQEVNLYVCSNCGKSFNFNSGLWAHKKQCKVASLNEVNKSLSSKK